MPKSSYRRHGLNLAVTGHGRYVRVYGTHRVGGYGYSLWEFQVSGTPGTPTQDGPGVTRVTGTQGNWQLTVDGAPWTVKGLTWGPPVSEAATRMPDLQSIGVNTVRTWGTDATTQPLLDAAAANGIKVVAGFWLQPGGGPGSGGCVDYITDTNYKNTMLGEIQKWVNAYKENPGVLMWNVGNESILGMQNCYSGTPAGAEPDRLRPVRQRGRAGDPRHRPEPPGHLDRRLDRRVAVLQGVHARPRPLRGQLLRRGVPGQAGLAGRRLHEAVHHHRDRPGRRVGGPERRERRPDRTDRPAEARRVRQRLELRPGPPRRGARRDALPLRHRRRLRRRLVQHHHGQRKAALLVRRPPDLQWTDGRQHPAGDLVDEPQPQHRRPGRRHVHPDDERVRPGR